MSEQQLIESALLQAARRRRWLRAIRGCWGGLLVGGLLWLVALGLFKLLPYPAHWLEGVGIVALLLPLVGFVWRGSQRISLEETARWMDERQQLQERFSTAYELSRKRDGDPAWTQLLLRDTVTFLSKFNPRKAFPHQLPVMARWLVVVLLASLGLGFVPEYRSKAYLQRVEEVEGLKEVGRRLAELTTHQLQTQARLMEPTEKAMEVARELGVNLAGGQLTRSEALKQLTDLSKRLEEQQQQFERTSSLKQLQKAAQQKPSDLPNAEGQEEQSGKAGGEAEEQAVESMQEKLQDLRRKAAALKDQDGAEAEATKQKLTAGMKELARQAASLGQEMPDLDEAIEALLSSKPDLLLAELEQASTDLEELKSQLDKMAQMKQKSQDLAKDLATQLDLGQAEAAQKTLEKMVEVLKKTSTTDAERKQLMEEVAKAIQPASDYGKVEGLLKQAASQLKAGQNPAAQQSLADAADELQKMLDQLQNSDSLRETLAALKKAEKAIANKKKWGQCASCSGEGCASCKGRWGSGSRGGAGVGDWAEDQEWDGKKWNQDEDQSEVDNSGMDDEERTQAGKEDTTRSEALSDSLSPDKLKGQFSPGGDLPSVPLRGVSIKGQSRVSVKSVTTSQQVTGDSSLNQDRVPKAYQPSVRQYFDDSKK